MNKMLLAISNKRKPAVKTLLRRKHTFYFAVEFGDPQRGYLSGPRWFTIRRTPRPSEERPDASGLA